VTASGATLQALSGAQLFSAYLGEGEALLRDAFSRARMAAPAIIFIDELDAVAGEFCTSGNVTLY
jgi:ATP-dependent 26S proteasome regulatory subunit